MRLVLAALAAFALTSFNLQAWGVEGHRFVAEIAAARLTPAARAEVTRLLGSHSMADVASCPDTIRDRRPQNAPTEIQRLCTAMLGTQVLDTGPWHYIDIPIPKGSRDLRLYCPGGACVTEKIHDFSDVLRTSTDDARRRAALVFLIHFVGDLQQPLHASDRACDRGGNREKVNFRLNGKEINDDNLHKVWDTDLISEAMHGTEESQFLSSLQRDISEGRARSWQRATPEAMAWESHELAVKHAYHGIPSQDFCPEPPPTSIVTSLDPKYEREGVKIVREQLKRGGVRLAAALNAALAAPPSTEEAQVFRGFTLIDGSGGPPQPNAAMIVRSGRIVWTGPASQLVVPAGAEVFNEAGRFIMPGIINLHGHLALVDGLKQDAANFTRANIEQNLRTYASYGVTSVLSLGTDQDLVYQIRDQQRQGRPDMTRIFTAGRGFTAKNGLSGMPGVVYTPETPAEAQTDVAQLASHHPDIVKMWVDDALGSRPKLSPYIAKTIIDTAHADNLPTAAHVFYLSDAKQLVDFGVNGLAHMVRDAPVDDQLIADMKQHNTWQMAATLTREVSTYVYAGTPPFLTDPFFTRAVSPRVVASLKDPAYQKRFASDPNLPRYRELLTMAQKNLKRLADAGIPYGFGTDSGPPGRFPGYFEQWEMELMVDAGLTPAQVIHAATGSGAKFLQAADLGTLSAGKWADFLILEKNPLDNIRNTRTLVGVYIAGNRADL